MEWTKQLPTKSGFYWIYTKSWEDHNSLLLGGHLTMIEVWDPTYGKAHLSSGATIFFDNVAYWFGPIEPPKPPDEYEYIYDKTIGLWVRKG